MATRTFLMVVALEKEWEARDPSSFSPFCGTWKTEGRGGLLLHVRLDRESFAVKGFLQLLKPSLGHPQSCPKHRQREELFPHCGALEALQNGEWFSLLLKVYKLKAGNGWSCTHKTSGSSTYVRGFFQGRRSAITNNGCLPRLAKICGLLEMKTNNELINGLPAKLSNHSKSQ